jgi:phosphoribosylglycinamide formyltransferase-1
MNQKFRIAIFASGSGSNAEEIIKYFHHHPSIKVVLVLSNNPKALVLERAKKFNIPIKVFNREEFTTTLVDVLKGNDITHIVLAGFLWLVPQDILKAYPNRIINIHPALLPKFGGHGMFGMKIHELVRKLNETETGITIHLVTEKYDEGQILYQGKCEVKSEDTPEQIAHKVHQLEYACYPKIIEKWILNGPDLAY